MVLSTEYTRYEFLIYCSFFNEGFRCCNSSIKLQYLRDLALRRDMFNWQYYVGLWDFLRLSFTKKKPALVWVLYKLLKKKDLSYKADQESLYLVKLVRAFFYSLDSLGYKITVEFIKKITNAGSNMLVCNERLC